MIAIIATLAALFILALVACVSYAIGESVGWARCEAAEYREYLEELDTRTRLEWSASDN